MEKSTRWLKGFLGLKKDKENVENNSNYGEKKEKRRWSFVKSAQAEVAIVILTSHGKGGFDWSFMAEDYKFSTTQSTPRFVTCGQANSLVTPTKSVFGDGFFRQYSKCPNYMSNTQSFRAKLRSLSDPKK
ncbi:unnamed protein product [Fraxinus pennsylvanica]|uniref:DUF4005 domain-containing protein n=1 Tax=Fraxinus pennsylvanica TaxID=56036 RepID=A0AAD1Z1B4_9LAMI|nr:unnamed protein product [Fraxinus pennsylvanica]